MPSVSRATAVSPRGRFIRTSIQILVSLLAAVPLALGALPSDPSDKHIIWAIGISNGLIILISAAQNAYEASKNVTFTPGDDNGQITWPVLAIFVLILIIILMATGAIDIRL